MTNAMPLLSWLSVSLGVLALLWATAFVGMVAALVVPDVLSGKIRNCRDLFPAIRGAVHFLVRSSAPRHPFAGLPPIPPMPNGRRPHAAVSVPESLMRMQPPPPTPAPPRSESRHRARRKLIHDR